MRSGSYTGSLQSDLFVDSVKPKGPGMMNKDQESDCWLIKYIYWRKLLAVLSAEASFNTREGVRRPPCLQFKILNNYTLTEIANYVSA